MTLARLLLAAILFCSLTAFAQDQPMSTTQTPGNSVASVISKASGPAPLEPWKIIPNRSSDLNSDSMDRIRVDQFRLDPGKVYPVAPKFTFKARDWDGALGSDTTCYTIRSYVVARDSKDSDSTHATVYSTCQPASRYRLKTTDERPLLLQH
jgi:hypothetical protein